MTTFRLAWRNLWRNTRRSVITMAAVGLNAGILILSYSLMDGIMIHTVENATNMVVGEAQIHAPKYLADRSIYKSLKDPKAIMAGLEREGLPASARSYGYGLAAMKTKSAGALFWGVDPNREKTTFDLAKHLGQGTWLSETPRKGLVLGKKLARSLKASVGSDIVVVVQAADGSLGDDLFTVTGVLKAAGEIIDRSAAIMHQEDFSELFVSGGRIHEIAINTRGKRPLEDIAVEAARVAPGDEVKTWRQLMPPLSDLINFFSAAVGMFGVIFFLAGALGVMNTMLMATFERLREFGIQKALGATPWRILRDVAAEAFVLGFVATAAGTAIGVGATYYFQEVGLDTTVFAAGDATIAGVAFDPIWRAVLSVKTVTVPVVIMWVVCLLASIYPAAIAARLDPVKAIHHV